MPSPIELFYQDSLRVLERLGGQDTSAEAWLRATLARTLVLVAVSYFEAELTAGLEAAYRRCLGEIPLLRLVQRKAIEMQFHSLFDWSGHNANRFLNFFGEPFPEKVREALRQRQESSADAAFIEIGALRNRLVHRGFATYPVDKTLEELHGLARRADLFVRVVLDEIGRCGPPARPEGGA